MNKEINGDSNNLFELINNRLEKKISENDFKIVESQIKKLLKIQNLTLSDIEFFENGQSYSALGIGDAVLKIGPDIKCVKNPYQLLPFHQENLKDSNQKVFLSQRANTKKISREDSQKLYNLIRDNGGIWVDPKENNVGTVSNRSIIFQAFENNVELYDAENKTQTYQGNKFIIDYEDVTFLTPKVIQDMRKQGNKSILPYGGKESNYIYTEYLNSESIDEIYEKNYIYPSETLLNYEKQYQLEKGNSEKVKQCDERLKLIEERRKQSEYEMKQMYKYGRRDKIGYRYNAKEIGMNIKARIKYTGIRFSKKLSDLKYSISSAIANRKMQLPSQFDDHYMPDENLNGNVSNSEKISDTQQASYDPWKTK